MIFPILPAYRIVVFDGELLDEHDDYLTTVVTWYDGYRPENCVAWFDAHFKDGRYQGMLCEISCDEGPIDYGYLH